MLTVQKTLSMGQTSRRIMVHHEMNYASRMLGHRVLGVYRKVLCEIHNYDPLLP